MILSAEWVEVGLVELSQTVSLPSLYCKLLLANGTSCGELLHYYNVYLRNRFRQSMFVI